MYVGLGTITYNTFVLAGLVVGGGLVGGYFIGKGLISN
jgi:hypothetical protein